MSHDINRDPEFCELVEAYGAPGIRVWLELLSISDRNEGEVPGNINSICTPLAGACNTKSSRVQAVLYWMIGRQWIENSSPIRIRNYAKYHISRDVKEILDGNGNGAPPNLPNLPNLPNRTLEPPIVPQTGDVPISSAASSLQYEPAAAQQHDPVSENGTGGEKTEYEPPHKKSTGYSAGFLRFCSLHPWGGRDRKEAWDVWVKQKYEPFAEDICQAVEQQKAWPEFAKEGFQYFPRMPRYLRRQRWKDDPPNHAQPSRAGPSAKIDVLQDMIQQKQGDTNGYGEGSLTVLSSPHRQLPGVAEKRGPEPATADIQRLRAIPH